MPFKMVRPRHRYNHPYIAHKHLYVNCLGGLLKNEGSINKYGVSKFEGENSKDVVSLEEYCKRSENELNKYNLRCTCDNLAGGVVDDKGAMHDAHVTLTRDLLEPLEKWNEMKNLEQRMAVQLRAEADSTGRLGSSFRDWEKARKDKARLGKMFAEAIEELRDFEALNSDYFCDMTTGRTLEEMKYWKNLKTTNL